MHHGRRLSRAGRTPRLGDPSSNPHLAMKLTGLAILSQPNQPHWSIVVRTQCGRGEKDAQATWREKWEINFQINTCNLVGLKFCGPGIQKPIGALMLKEE